MKKKEEKYRKREIKRDRQVGRDIKKEKNREIQSKGEKERRRERDIVCEEGNMIGRGCERER